MENKKIQKEVATLTENTVPLDAALLHEQKISIWILGNSRYAEYSSRGARGRHDAILRLA
jgi:hypothetical protein